MNKFAQISAGTCLCSSLQTYALAQISIKVQPKVQVCQLKERKKVKDTSYFLKKALHR